MKIVFANLNNFYKINICFFKRDIFSLYDLISKKNGKKKK